MNRFSRTARATALSAATLLTAMGIAAGSADTAQAAAPVCAHKGAISFSGGVLSAWAETWCHAAPDPEIAVSPDPVVILRLNAGTWSPFLTGSDTVNYQCVNGTTNSYRLDNGYIVREIDAVPCG